MIIVLRGLKWLVISRDKERKKKMMVSKEWVKIGYQVVSTYLS